MTQAGARIFEGRVAIVTGAGNGIGRAEAMAFANLGARVVVNDLARGTPTLAEKVVQEIHNAGGEAVAANASVSKAEGAAAIVSTAVDAWGRLDFLVNNAGFGRVSPIWETTETEWDTVNRRQPEGVLPDGAGGLQDHAGAELRRDHQHQFGVRNGRQLFLQLHGGQGRCGRTDAGHRARPLAR